MTQALTEAPVPGIDLKPGIERSATACAKLNLSLHVVGRRADGYHLLESLVVFVETGDELTISSAPADTLDISGPFAGSLQGGPNILHQALTLLRTAASQCASLVPPLAIHLRKNLPVASGIGGGSADAAALLRMLLPGLPKPAQIHVATACVQLGADVPMCLLQQPAIARGVGENLQPLPNMPRLPIVMVNPGIAVSTPVIFGRLEQRNNAPMQPVPDIGFATASELLAFLAASRNDLQLPASQLAPEILTALAALDFAGARLSRMSGSGATVFGIFETGQAADHAARTLAHSHPAWWVKATTTL
ncbi:4-(cytidine 5'-diphospho)-2-C-methyl-D-erythritol kinase [Aureimonas fodinaquatilis]|uniref:4-diphosphocytidyl-2-C-methyl-D-erythritol kinase n=1 Tax=Aureimonas fodinaquatilis TaxID=2565783 RepID=A0A5B0E1C1_9HYPH|nr:4-(cytidine 5'-diphospho)-2-C-methyl-D-erythritol kinase [Aureimonas fodinaquatilis]KAA0972446.1 4-(cytidine 5'-diphospho)-2-C-methyl-D-erythritol kinase [Aureimonas fodinaquatilis]